MLAVIILGALQGTTEWLPVSSEGIVAAAYSFSSDRPLSEAVTYALWLHLGTALSAIIAFRRDIKPLIVELASIPRHPSPMLLFLITSTGVSGVLGFPLLIFLDNVSSRFGAMVMVLLGGLMLVTGCIQLVRRAGGQRGRDDVTAVDGVITGITQGFAVLPGLSRSGLTVATLLARGMNRRTALALSFLMSIPVSLGAGLYASVSGDFATSANGVLAAMVAFLLGLVTIRGLMAVAERLNFGVFVLSVGVLVIAGALWQTTV